MAAGRVVAPIMMNGVRVGWQARLVGEPRYNTIPKYYTCPGMPKSQVLYNFDTARGEPYVIVVEGITDVWRIGDQAVALLGKTLSRQQSRLLTDTWPGKPIIVMLDGEARQETDAIVAELVASGRNPVVPIRLDPGWDPADYDRDALRNMIKSQARQVGVELD